MNSPIPAHITPADDLGGVARSIFLMSVRSLSYGGVRRDHDSMEVPSNLAKGGHSGRRCRSSSPPRQRPIAAMQHD